jgi:hydroxymethylpyrimidine pyrophosphatase-like HAD family hydrolase
MNGNIKAVVLDVDGILVGLEGGVNFPKPNAEIIDSLKKINGNGIPVILCTGRPFYTPAMDFIIKNAGLDNFHVGNFGSQILNPISRQNLFMQGIDTRDSLQIADSLVGEKILTAAFTDKNIIVQKNQADLKVINPLARAIQTYPIFVDSLEDEIKNCQVLRFLLVSESEQAYLKVEKILSRFGGKFNLFFGNNPNLRFNLFDIMPKEISKPASLKFLLNHLNISFDDVLGVGDGDVDWEFMELCGYRGTLQNAVPKVLQNVAVQGKERNFIGPHVDQSGILDVFKYFGLSILKNGVLSNI